MKYVLAGMIGMILFSVILVFLHNPKCTQTQTVVWLEHVVGHWKTTSFIYTMDDGSLFESKYLYQTGDVVCVEYGGKRVK